METNGCNSNNHKEEEGDFLVAQVVVFQPHKLEEDNLVQEEGAFLLEGAWLQSDLLQLCISHPNSSGIMVTMSSSKQNSRSNCYVERPMAELVSIRDQILHKNRYAEYA
jgi:hypothetical protein